MRKVLWSGFLVLAGALAACAQISFPNGSNEIAGAYGICRISNQSVVNSGLSNPALTFGTGYSFEVNYTRILRSKDWADLGIEVPAVFDPDEDLHFQANQVPEGYSAIFITPAARIRFFPYTAISPWVSFGGGLGHFSASSSLLFSGTNTANRSATSGVLQGGLGLDVRLPCECTNRLRLRAEGRDNWSGMPPLNVNTGKARQHNYFIAAGLVYQF